jgi:hypothetical protein
MDGFSWNFMSRGFQFCDISLNSSQNTKKVRIKVVEKIKIYISRHAHRFPTSCSIFNNYKKYRKSRQAIKSSKSIWCREDSTGKPGVKTKNAKSNLMVSVQIKVREGKITESQYVILTAVQLFVIT